MFLEMITQSLRHRDIIVWVRHTHRKSVSMHYNRIRTDRMLFRWRQKSKLIALLYMS